ncbi:hypothetical protein [Streptomyces sp. NRRL S-37]|uniref:hypothetical protein n=1 Tax=Streptomyces sp. NRRL S-37 TaxID=1463903 RepID=UPI00131B62BA|nr:hypothetical protein [Streptomyces sp. NRRL S-37]
MTGTHRTTANADGPPEAPRGRTRWGVAAAILGLPALAVTGFLTLMALWVLFAES